MSVHSTFGKEPEMNGIVVGVDGSAGAKAALRFALEEGRLRGTTVHAVHAWHVPATMYGGGPFTAVPNLRSELEGGARAILESCVSEVADQAAGVTLEPTLVEANAPAALVEAAKDADLLVVGSRGHGGFASLLLGSVSQQCAHHAPCPIVIVPAKQD
jgi:nucleotide-binding universal stress UspA family protein